uniref:C-type lectin domain family 2 member D-like n=1 Tax=Podarcis muralis TaxID=64176 RepID=A0A670IRD0_PODMU|nr:C-type lectin domain family 2 member D-like isoform X2 [Podarcis muralis]
MPRRGTLLFGVNKMSCKCPSGNKKAFVVFSVIAALGIGIGIGVGIERSNERKCNETGSELKSALPAHSIPPCPPLWFWYEGICYFFSNNEKSWMSSQEYCLSFNASLAVIPNNEKDIVKRWKGTNSYWIGLRRDPGQPWKWTNGENSTFEVLGDGGDCAYLGDKGQAYVSRCNVEHHWMCRKLGPPASADVAGKGYNPHTTETEM